jgi:putative RNA 2'-phosphotransferase
VQELITKAELHGKVFSDDKLLEVVMTNDKQRFSLSDDRLKIRANQGHSLTVDLALTARQPPAVLYHGTATRFLDAILSTGLKPQARQYVHLSQDKTIAISVGQRHGKVIVQAVAAATMQQQGYRFYLSDNQVWLTTEVPVEFLTVLHDN